MSASPTAAANASAPARSRIRALRRSSSSADEIARCLCRVVTRFRLSTLLGYRLRPKDRQPRFNCPPSAHLVNHVDTVVLLVRAGDAEEERRPAPEAETTLVGEAAVEDKLAVAANEVDALVLADPVYVHLDGPGRTGRQLHARLLCHPHRMPASCAARSWLCPPRCRLPCCSRERRPRETEASRPRRPPLRMPRGSPTPTG